MNQVAIEGCLHGELQEVYHQLQKLQQSLSIKIDLLIVCGDFQALRNQIDLNYLHCPPKYKAMGSFYQYFSQKKEPPYLTIFIGGNHEAVNYMRGLYYGGWVAKNIYYLGQAGSIYVSKGKTKIRITGISGIYNHRDFQYTLKPQRLPLEGGAKISAYHIKQLQTFRIQMLSRIAIMKQQEPQKYGKKHKKFDIFLSHDWPKNIALYGKTNELYKYKPFLEKEIIAGTFGSPPSERIMQLAKPTYWFSAHMHIKYPALYPHNQNEYTHFLALDKCLPKKHCLQILHFSSKTSQSEEPEDSQQMKIVLDPVWLCVLLQTQYLFTKGEIFYKYDKDELKLISSKLMNECLQNFPRVWADFGKQVETQGKDIQELQLKRQNDNQQKEAWQLQQTQHLLNLIGIDKKEMKRMQGIIFPRGYFQNYSTQRLGADDMNPDQQVFGFGEKEIADKPQNRRGQVQDEIQLDL